MGDSRKDSVDTLSATIAENEASKALSIRMLSAIVLVAAIVLSFVALGIVWHILGADVQSEAANERYIECEDAVEQLSDASDFLTAQARMFVVTGDREYLENYLEELYIVDRRGVAYITLERYLGNNAQATETLEEAKDLSDNLAAIELRAMRLAAEGHGVYPMPDALINAVLDDGDLEYSDEDKIDVATRLVTSGHYIRFKNRINEHVQESSKDLAEDLRYQHEQSDQWLTSLLGWLQVAIVLLLFVGIANVALFMRLVSQPIDAYIKHIGKGNRLIPRGASELRYLAAAYNSIFDKNNERAEMLQRAAEHDPLTGLRNRSAYEDFLEQTHESVALILIDIDHFKEFNDQYGHEVGDAVLKAVGASIAHSFRATDIPCRVGGDEFAVIMTDMHPNLRHVVIARINGVLDALQAHVEEWGMHPITLSMGVAFSEDVSEEESLYRAADTALYIVKERGRNGYEFYNPALFVHD